MSFFNDPKPKKKNWTAKNVRYTKRQKLRWNMYDAT
jgi:hypothetical protein